MICYSPKIGGVTIGRSKEFDKEQVLHNAMLVFWEKGYAEASIPDLLDAMGLSRSSLYETFGDKETLYKEALQQYKKIGESKRNLLINAESAKEGIRQYFEKHIAFVFDDELPNGCLITKAAVGLDTPDEEMRNFIRDRFNQLEQLFYELLKKGQQAGEIDSSKDIKVISFLLLNLNHSINVSSKVKTDRKMYHDMINSVIETL